MMSEQKVPRSVEQRIVIKFLVGENVPYRDKWRKFVKATINLRVEENKETSLTSYGTNCSSRKIMLHRFCQLVSNRQ